MYFFFFFFYITFLYQSSTNTRSILIPIGALLNYWSLINLWYYMYMLSWKKYRYNLVLFNAAMILTRGELCSPRNVLFYHSSVRSSCVQRALSVSSPFDIHMLSVQFCIHCSPSALVHGASFAHRVFIIRSAFTRLSLHYHSKFQSERIDLYNDNKIERNACARVQTFHNNLVLFVF